MRAREGACLGNRCNYSARCVRSGVGGGVIGVNAGVTLHHLASYRQPVTYRTQTKIHW